MNTFLPFKSYRLSAVALDSERLGKQRAEVKQLLIASYLPVLQKNIFLAEQVLPDPSKLGEKKYLDSYRRIAAHPCCKMWEDYPSALIAYGMAVCQEWTRRGNADSVYTSLEAFAGLAETVYPEQEWMAANAPNLVPKWLGDERLHSSHRRNLVRKDPAWYQIGLGWTDEPSDEYFWPHEHYDYGG